MPGEADATINFEVVGNEEVLGTGSVTANSDGEFIATVHFDDIDRGDELELRVTQTTADGVSPARSVDLVQWGVPDAPTVESPEADAFVASPLNVTGTTEPGATVSLTVKQGTAVVGDTSVEAGGDGSFAGSIEFTAPEPNAELVVSVVAENEIGESEATTVDVVFLSVNVSGHVVLSELGSPGTVYVSVTTSSDEYLDTLQRVGITIDNPDTTENVDFSLDVAPGTYYLRAFHDLENEGQSDGYPSLLEPQSSVVEVEVDEDLSEVVIELADPGLGEGRPPYELFDAFIFSDDPDSNWDEYSCAGISLRLQLTANTEVELDASEPMVRAPNGDDLELVDDGDCLNPSPDSGSYDEQPDDNIFSAGFDSPSRAQGGLYLMHYTLTGTDFIHVEGDEVSTDHFSREVYLTRPAGNVAITSGTPTLIWAGQNEGAWVRPFVSLSEEEFIQGPWTQDGEYTLEEDVTDDYLTLVTFEVADANPDEGDIDAWASSDLSAFIRDADGGDTVTLSGAIRNNSGVEGNIHIRVEGADGLAGSIVVESGENSYEMAVLSTEGNESELYAYIEVEGRRQSEISVRDLSLAEDRSGLDLIFPVAVDFGLVSPTDGETGVSDTPTFSWDDASDAVPGDSFQYAVDLYQTGADPDDADGIWVVDGSETSFDLGDPSSHLDGVLVFGCIDNDGTFAEGECSSDVPSSVSDLSEATNWSWSVKVFSGCDFSDWEDDNDTNTNDINDYVDCMMGLTEDSFVSTEVWSFSTD